MATRGLSLAIMNASRYSPSNKIVSVNTGNQANNLIRIARFSNIGQIIINIAARKVNSSILADIVGAIRARLMKATAKRKCQE